MQNKLYKKILEKIKKYDNIVVLRHEQPDFDASGCQFGLSTWLKDNFPNKNIYALGKKHKFFCDSLFLKTDEIDNIPKPYLVFILDTANFPRIDKKEVIADADYTIKIDHHPLCEDFGDLVLVDTSYSACAERIAEMLLSFKKYKMSKQTAYYLFAGIVGDNGRFQYSSTSPRSLRIAASLMETGFDFTDIYEKMYIKSIDEIKIITYIYQNYKISEHGVIYFYFPIAEQKRLGIEKEQVKAYVNLFSNYKESRIWVTFTEDPETLLWNVSIRSRKITINEVATKFNGGGHANASGARLENIELTQKLIEELDKLLV